MTYWMEVSQWLLIGGAAGVALGELVGRPLVLWRRRVRRMTGR